DVIGVLQFEFPDWYTRRTATEILEDFRERTADIAGIELEFRKQEGGPAEGKPIELQVSSMDSNQLDAYVDTIENRMRELGGFVDIEDDRSLPGIEWRLNVDREAAARFGTDVLSIGSAVRLVTNGLVLATYRPEDVRDEVDIAVRVPNNWRELDHLERQTLNTPRGQVPLSEFVDLEPGDKTGSIVRVDGQRTITIKSDVAPGRRMDELLRTLQAEMPEPPEGVSVRFAGENEDQQQAANFLTSAFLVAVGL